jgi:uncharacterized protein
VKPHFLQPLLRRSPAPLVARNQRTGRLVATTLETAFDSGERRKGLLGRQGLPAGHALIIAPCSLVHTFNMRFPIDILFVARDGRVLKARHGVPRSRIAGAFGAFAVIELAAGALAASGTAPNDVVEIVSA